MKYLLTLMAIFAMVSCSDDDNNDNDIESAQAVKINEFFISVTS